MARTVTYTCDCCGHTQDKPDQMWNIGYGLWHENTQPDVYAISRQSKMWCRKCVEALGLLSKPKTAVDPIPVQPPTLEDIIRAISREEAEQVVDEKRG